MVSGKRSRTARRARSGLLVQSTTPWGTIAAVLVIVMFAGAVFGYVYWQGQATKQRAALQAAFVPSAANPDPSTTIPGVTVTKYKGGVHAGPGQRVAYDVSPPAGGAHAQDWAACTGVVYPQAVRTENMVHSMEHGAVWVAYNPDQILGPALDVLAARVTDKPYMLMSPYPGLDSPISLQSWQHQLKLTTPDDPRIDQFITAQRSNQYTGPEKGASCQALGPGQFDPNDPPPFDPTPPGPPGPNVLAVNAAAPTPGR